jgi:hypothetical protein
VVRVIFSTTPRLRAAIPYAAPPSPSLASTDMLVDLPFPGPASLLLFGIYPNLSSPQMLFTMDERFLTQFHDQCTLLCGLYRPLSVREELRC